MFKLRTKLKKTTELSNVIHEVSDSVRLLKYKVSEINKHSIINWSKNRPPDNVRINEIYKYYSENNITFIPGMIYAWQRPNSTNLEVYDGIHRLLAAFNYNNDIAFIMCVRITDDESDIVKDFTNINKSVSVPSIFLEETNVFKKMVCQNVAERLCKEYPAFVSPSRKPYVYNFNRDNVIEFISTLEVDFCKSNVDIEIFNELNGLNAYAADFVKRNKIAYPKKCEYHKFYLFFLKNEYIKTKIEQVLNN